MRSTSPDAGLHPGLFNYLTGSAPSSLYRTGAVLTRRDRDGSDAGTEGVEREAREVPVGNARQREKFDRLELARNGFELVVRPLEDPNLDFLHHDTAVREYYPACSRLVQEATGAPEVFAFDHNVRSAAGKTRGQRIVDGQQIQGPGHMVHGDYTLTSAPQRLRDLMRPPGENDTLRSMLAPERGLLDPARVERALGPGGRFALINVWRNIAEGPVMSHPLALCDAESVRPEDLVVFEIHYADRIGENYFAKHSPRHRWYYYPLMTRDEALLIKQWDSAGELARSDGARADSEGQAPCTFSFHSAFEELAAGPDAPERWSIEVRCVALY